MSLKPGKGVQLGFAAESGLTLRVCRVGRDPLIADGGTETLWCPDYASFSDLIPLPADDLSQLQAEASRGFVGDLAQGIRPMPRTHDDLRWYDRGLNEGWLPAHRVRVDEDQEKLIRGPWEQFHVVGATPAYGDGHTPAIAQTILQAKDRRTYLLLENIDEAEVVGVPQSHGWWVNQVSSGAALPLEHPVDALAGYQLLVLRGGERVLAAGACRYLSRDALAQALKDEAKSALLSAEGALRRNNPIVAGFCVSRGLRAMSDHPGLLALREKLGSEGSDA